MKSVDLLEDPKATGHEGLKSTQPYTAEAGEVSGGDLSRTPSSINGIDEAEDYITFRHG